jgi:hypothetical protein
MRWKIPALILFNGGRIMHGAQGNEQYKNIHIKMSDLEKYTAMYKQHISMKLPPFLKQ